MKNNFLEWSTDEVMNWFRLDIKLSTINYDLIKSHEINGRDLIDLNEENLRDDLKILKLHERKYIMRKICDLMRTLVETDPKNENESENLRDEGNDFRSGDNSDLKIYNIKFKERSIRLKCADNIKVEHVIKECIDVFNLNNLSGCNSNYQASNCSNFYLSDMNNIIFPKETFMCDILLFENHQNNQRQEFVTFLLHINDDEEFKSRQYSFNINKENQSKSTCYSDHPHKTIDTKEKKEAVSTAISSANSYSQMNSNHVNNISNHNNNNKYSCDSSHNRSNYNKDFTLTDTAVKNRIVSFEALDTLEKNGYSLNSKNFKKSEGNLNKTNEEKVTINSFYNISNTNMNNFNDKLMQSNRSLIISNDKVPSKANPHFNILTVDSKKEKPAKTCLNCLNSKINDIDELSENNAVKENQIKMESPQYTLYNDKNVEIKEYMRMLSLRNSLNSSQEKGMNRNHKQKNNVTDKFIRYNNTMQYSKRDENRNSNSNKFTNNSMNILDTNNHPNETTKTEIEKFIRTINSKSK